MYRILIEAGARKVEIHYDDVHHMEYGLTQVAQLVVVSGLDDALVHLEKVLGDLADRGLVVEEKPPVDWPA